MASDVGLQVFGVPTLWARCLAQQQSAPCIYTHAVVEHGVCLDAEPLRRVSGDPQMLKFCAATH